MKRYTGNYLRIYFWQTLSILLNLGSLFIVLPHLTGNKALYGIYSVCIAATIFFSYMDLGFINAGVKYGAEYYIKGDVENEKKTIGFSMAIFVTLVLLFCLGISYLAFHQEMLFNHLTDGEASVARKLLLILAGSSILVVAQRCLQMIYSIRVEDYYFQMFLIASSLMKIAAVFVFFKAGHYDIVGYFLCIQVLTLLCLACADFLSYRKYGISFVRILPYIRFSREVYNRMKGLAFGTLFLTISWVLYYELDPYVLARLSDPGTVALYSVGLTLLSFFRSILGALFNPFNVRFNHMLGMGDEQSLKGLYGTVISVLLPLVVFPILSACILAKPFIECWIGPEYSASVPAARFLMSSNLWGFIAYPTGILLVARKEMRLMYVIGVVQPVMYWTGIALFYRFVGFNIFAICTFMVFTNMAIFYTRYSERFLGMSFTTFARKYLLPALPSIVLMTLLLLWAEPHLPTAKGVANLLAVIATGACGVICGLIVYYFSCPEFSGYIRSLIRGFIKIK
jgi:O-antigen/teichoic acid export membrane protein